MIVLTLIVICALILSAIGGLWWLPLAAGFLIGVCVFLSRLKNDRAGRIPG